MIHHIWFIMIAMSMLYACMTGNGERMLQAALNGSEKALTLVFQLAPSYLFFCGMMKIARSVRIEKWLTHLFDPVLKILTPNLQHSETRGAMAMNLVLNMLGMGNAATPAGIEAMRKMELECREHSAVRHDMEMFLILNAAGFQLVPTTVLAMRAAAGSASINAVVMPAMACTAASAAVSIALGLFCRRRKGKEREG